MYGRFEDISAEEFLAVQLDLSEFRVKWDETTIGCKVLQEDFAACPFCKKSGEDSGGPVLLDLSQVYYWEVRWPRLFSNRDYCCLRRTCVYDSGSSPKGEKVAVVFTESTINPACQQKNGNFRVEDYWSVLTIRPFTDFDKPGVEFTLTAFEDPGVSLPAHLTTWVAMRGMPEYMKNLRKACLELRKLKLLDGGILLHPRGEQSGGKQPSSCSQPRTQTSSYSASSGTYSPRYGAAEVKVFS